MKMEDGVIVSAIAYQTSTVVSFRNSLYDSEFKLIIHIPVYCDDL